MAASISRRRQAMFHPEVKHAIQSRLQFAGCAARRSRPRADDLGTDGWQRPPGQRAGAAGGRLAVLRQRPPGTAGRGRRAEPGGARAQSLLSPGRAGSGAGGGSAGQRLPGPAAAAAQPAAEPRHAVGVARGADLLRPPGRRTRGRCVRTDAGCRLDRAGGQDAAPERDRRGRAGRVGDRPGGGPPPPSAVRLRLPRLERTQAAPRRRAGAALLEACLRQGWLRPQDGSRALQVSSKGRAGLRGLAERTAG